MAELPKLLAFGLHNCTRRPTDDGPVQNLADGSAVPLTMANERVVGAAFNSKGWV